MTSLRIEVAKIIEPELWNPPAGSLDFITSENAKRVSLEKADAVISLITKPSPKPFARDTKEAYDFIVEESEEMIRFAGLPDPKLDPK